MQFPCKNLEERITKNNIPMNPSERMGRQGSPFFFVECCPARFAVLRTLEMHIGFSVVTSLNSPLMEEAQAWWRSATLQKQVDWWFKDSVGHLLRPFSQRGKNRQECSCLLQCGWGPSLILITTKAPQNIGTTHSCLRFQGVPNALSASWSLFSSYIQEPYFLLLICRSLFAVPCLWRRMGFFCPLGVVARVKDTWFFLSLEFKVSCRYAYYWLPLHSSLDFVIILLWWYLIPNSWLPI